MSTILDIYDDAALDTIKRDFNQIERGAYKAPRENLDAIQSAPVKAGVNKGVLTYTYNTISQVGMAKIVASDAKDLPPVSIGLKHNTVEIRQVGDSYKFTQEEMDACAYAGIPLSEDDALAARQKIDEKIDEIIYVGDTAYNIPGLLTNTNVNLAVAGTSASGSSTKWADKTIDEITADIQKMIDTVFAVTKGPRGGATVTCDTIKIPRDAYVSLTTRTKGVDSDVTFLAALQQRFAPQGLVNFECCTSADAAGASGASRALLYKKAPENVFSIIPVPFRVLPAQYRGLSVIFNCLGRTAGCCWRRPTTGCYMDGI